MGPLIRTALKFNNLLIIARVDALEQIRQLYLAAKAIYLTKDLWLSAVEYEPMAESPLNKIIDLTKKYFWNASKYGISASQSAQYLNSLKKEANDLEEAKLIQPLDPNATKALEIFKSTLHNIIPFNIKSPKVKEELISPIPADVLPTSPKFYLRS